MTFFQYLGVLLTAATVFGAVTLRFLKIPLTIGIMAISLVTSILLLITQHQHPVITEKAITFVSSMDWEEFVMKGILGPLLFFGALHVPLDGLKRFKLTIASLASVSVVISTVVIGYAAHFILGLLGFDISIWWTLAFGAILSPSDPIAVMALLKQAGVSKDLEDKIAGESLANDGPSVVAYMTLAAIAVGAGTDMTFSKVASTLVSEVVGGIVYGILIGYIGLSVLRLVAQSPIMTFVLLGAMATAGYSGAYAVHVSAPLAAVVMGLVVANWGLAKQLKAEHKESVDELVSVADTLLNIVLFMVIGLEILALTLKWSYLAAGLLMVPAILCARFLSVGAPIVVLRRFEPISAHAVKVMTWGGLRGGISIAMAVSTPVFPGRDVLICVVYVCVVFSLLVQALSLPYFIQKLNLSKNSEGANG